MANRRLSKGEVVVYRGIKFFRYPDSENRTDRIYFSPGIGHRKKGVARLHQEIWKDTHGPIPEGHEIHHRDGNPLNNDLGNLDCITSEEHAAIHAALMTEEEKQRRREWINSIRGAASAWHGSEAGRAWHAELGKISWEDRKVERFVCQQCGVEYESRSSHGRNRFCSNNCKSAARRASGTDDVVAKCVGCRKTFSFNRFKPRRFCSRACSNRARSQE